MTTNERFLPASIFRACPSRLTQLGLFAVSSIALGGAVSCAGKQSAAPVSSSAAGATAGETADSVGVRPVLAMPHRSDANRARDKYRHPVETLNFFGLRPDMNVVEIWPGGGWYTEILAPLLRDKGKLAVTNTPTGKKYDEMLGASTDLYGKVEVRRIKPPEEIHFGPAGSADMLLTFRNVHGWMPKGYDGKVFAAAFSVLKSGGIFGVVEHRAKAGADPAALKDTGYVPEDYVIRKVEEAGFRLVAKSEVNANPKDSTDHPKGVWTLPPSLRLGEQDKEKYLAIGESDRMTLKFVKP
jgi:predicted methyltransferase